MAYNWAKHKDYPELAKYGESVCINNFSLCEWKPKLDSENRRAMTHNQPSSPKNCKKRNSLFYITFAFFKLLFQPNCHFSVKREERHANSFQEILSVSAKIEVTDKLRMRLVGSTKWNVHHQAFQPRSISKLFYYLLPTVIMNQDTLLGFFPLLMGCSHLHKPTQYSSPAIKWDW